MIQTKVFSKQDAIATLIKKSQHVISAPVGAKRYKVMNNPIPSKGKEGSYFFNIDAMSAYHIGEAQKALAEGRYSDATNGFGVTIWENQLGMLNDIYKGGEVLVEIVQYHHKTNGVLDYLLNPATGKKDIPDMRLDAKLLKPIIVDSNVGVDMSSMFASLLEDSSVEDTTSTDEPQ